jgi:hypothetical protein
MKLFVLLYKMGVLNEKMCNLKSLTISAKGRYMVRTLVHIRLRLKPIL